MCFSCFFLVVVVVVVFGGEVKGSIHRVSYLYLDGAGKLHILCI